MPPSSIFLLFKCLPVQATMGDAAMPLIHVNVPRGNGSPLSGTATDDATNGAKLAGSDILLRSPFRFWSGR